MLCLRGWFLPDPATTNTDTEPFCPGLCSDPCRKIPNNRKINTVINTTAVRMTPLTTAYSNAISYKAKRYQLLSQNVSRLMFVKKEHTFII